jgi:hypothetical protein
VSILALFTHALLTIVIQSLAARLETSTSKIPCYRNLPQLLSSVQSPHLALVLCLVCEAGAQMHFTTTSFPAYMYNVRPTQHDLAC